MKKIKLAFVNVMDSYSGGEIVLQRLIRNLDKTEFDILVYTKDTKFVETLNCEKCEIVTFNTQYQMRLKRGLLSLSQAIKNLFISGKYMYQLRYRHKVDLVHSNSLTSNIYFAIWAKIFGVKFIAHSHEIRDGRLYKIIHKYIEFCSDRIITVSNAVKNNWLDHGVDKNKIITVYNGLDDDFF
ncbi:glycosyltransferase [Aliarcobacter skirrowii]|uniref:glycosyltransferase n=1 Tax=Aliarcobacter skirrowii TaxID=28200 RepID=UPI00083636E9|nr:glycosyltransferase [Aliarcobacter skirrowii]